jgi:hypothetical protein
LKDQLIKIKLVAATVSLLVGAIIVIKVASSTTNQVARQLGKRNYIRIISEPDSVQLFQTTTFLSNLTNGPMPEPFEIIEPGIKLAKPAITRLQGILLDPNTYLKGREDTTTPPEFVLRFKKSQDTLDLEFSADFFTMLVRHNGTFGTLLNCERARDDFERIIDPILGNHPSLWRTN